MVRCCLAALDVLPHSQEADCCLLSCTIPSQKRNPAVWKSNAVIHRVQWLQPSRTGLPPRRGLHRLPIESYSCERIACRECKCFPVYRNGCTNAQFGRRDKSSWHRRIGEAMPLYQCTVEHTAVFTFQLYNLHCIVLRKALSHAMRHMLCHPDSGAVEWRVFRQKYKPTSK